MNWGFVSERPGRVNLFVLLLPALTLASPATLAAAPCAGGDLQGVVFHDYDADAVRGSGNVEAGIGGAVVGVFSADGSSFSCETLADGSYGIDAPSGGFPLRVEVTLPGGVAYAGLRPGKAGTTTAFFVAAPASGVDVGLNVPTDFCQDNPEVVTSRFLQGDPLAPGSVAGADDAIVSLPYDRSSPPATLATGSQVGAVWGLAYQRSSRSFFAAAVLKRHAGFGPQGIGGIYRVDLSSGSPVVSDFVDLADLGVPVGADPRGVAGQDPPGNGPTGNEPGLDNLAYEQAGKVGIGDIDIEEETGRLWVMSLGDRRLYALDIGRDGTAPATATAFPLPAVTCVDGVFRPWAVASHLGRIYIGGVCSNESISPYPTNNGVFVDLPNLVGRVYSMDPADGVFSLELTIPLNYRKGCAGGATGCQFFPWTDLSTAAQVASPTIPSHPTPLLSDIEFADDGDMIVGLSDRTGFQYGVRAPAPNSNGADSSVSMVFAGGDMLRADFDAASGAFTLEANGSVGGVAGAGAGNLQGPGGGEYYSASTAGFHFELSLGGYAVLRGSNHFVGSAMDPVTINSGGLLWMNDRGATPGSPFAGYTLYASQLPPTFAKGVGVGDVELRCEEAPIEIGNRVWCDATDGQQLGDGAQGPGGVDAPVSGATVALSCNGGAITATTVTAADGTYLFSAANVPGGLPPGALCTLSVDAGQVALGSCNLPARPNAGGADPGGDLRDSDGVDPDHDGVSEVSVTIGLPGFNDHSIDFGFVTRPAFGTIGDTVWCDGVAGHNDGVFTPGEGLGGVAIQLFADGDCDGLADGGVLATELTGGDGQYLFTGLPIGWLGVPLCYVVRVDPADPALGECNDPITPLELPRLLDEFTPSDVQNDFGFEIAAPVVEIPTVSDFGLELLAALLALVGVFALRRR